MWVIFGARTKARIVKDGRAGQLHCEGCKEVATFRECDVVDKFHAFFVELFETTQRRMVCVACGEDHDIDEFFKKARPLPPPAPDKPSLWDRLRGRVEGASEQAPKGQGKQDQNKQAETKQLKTEQLKSKPDNKKNSDKDIDEELAALKRKLASKDRS